MADLHKVSKERDRLAKERKKFKGTLIQQKLLVRIDTGKHFSDLISFSTVKISLESQHSFKFIPVKSLINMNLFIVFFTDELKMLDRVRVKIASFVAIIKVITQH